MYSIFFRKHIALLKTEKGGVTSLMAIYIFLTEKLIRQFSNMVCRIKIFALANKNGCPLLIEVIGDGVKFVLINIYNCNTEPRQLLTLTELHRKLQNVDDIGNKNIIIGGNFNFHFNSKLEAKEGNLTLKKKSVGKIIEIIEGFELCDIWKI